MRGLAEVITDTQPLKLPPTASVAEAYNRMHELHTDTVVVTDDKGHLEGIFTEHDFDRRITESGKDSKATTMAEVMTANPCALSPDTSAIEALRVMWDGGFDHVPIVQSDRVLAIVSRKDFNRSEEECLSRERELWEHMR